MHDLALSDDCRRHRNPRRHPLRALPLRRPIERPEVDWPTSSREVRRKLGCSWYCDRRLRGTWLRLLYEVMRAPSRRDAFEALEAFDVREPAWFRVLVFDNGYRGHLCHPYQYGVAHRPTVLGVPLVLPTAPDADPLQAASERDLAAAVHAALEKLPPRQRRAVSLRAGLEPMPCEACSPGNHVCTCHGDPPTYAAIGRVLGPGASVSAEAVRGLVRRGVAGLARDAGLQKLAEA